MVIRIPVRPRAAETKTSLASQIPPWFAAAFAVVYSTGYLIDFYFYSYLGITDTGEQALKLKYLQTGLGFFLPYFLTGVYLLFSVFGLLQQYHQFRRSLFMNLLVPFTLGILWPLSTYAAVTFAPTHFFYDSPRHYEALLVLVLIVVPTYFISTFVVERLPQAIRETALAALLGAAAVCMIVADYFVFRDLDSLGNIFSAGWWFFAFTTTVPMIIYRIVLRLEKLKGWFSRVGYTLLLLGSLLIVHYLAVVSYAYGILPNIPSTKGGADFTRASRISVVMKEEKGSTIPSTDLSNAVLVYSTPTTIYLAKLTASADACAWRSRRALPSIVQVNRSEIRSISTHPLDTKNNEVNCCSSGNTKNPSWCSNP
jgi:hypothetical protein